MPQLWALNVTTIMRHDEWLLQVICDVDEAMRFRVLLLFWRLWHIRNELVHDKPAPPIDVSVRFYQVILIHLLAASHAP